MLFFLLPLFATAAGAVPSFDVDLDLPPKQRWREVALYYKDLMPPIFTVVFEGRSLDGFLQAYNLSEEHLAELQGMVEVVDSPEVTLSRLILFQLGYEWHAGLSCSGVLAAMPNGTVVHGRNMDYNVTFPGPDGRMRDLADVTYEVTWLRSGQPIMVSVQFLPMIGITTGMRIGGWSFQQNTRPGSSDVASTLAAARRGAEGYELLARRVMEQVPDFASAVDALYGANLMAPQYFIMAGAGPYEGAVITIDREGQHLRGTPPVQRLGRRPGGWHLVQTNDDLYYLPRDARRPFINLALAASDQEQVSTDFVLQLLRTFPATHSMTVYTWVAVPASGFHQTTLNRQQAVEVPQLAAQPRGKGGPSRGLRLRA